MKSVLSFLKKYLTAVMVLGILLVVALIALFAHPNEDGTRTYDGNAPTYTATQEAAYCDAITDNDEAIAAFSGINVAQDAGSGCEPRELAQMGALAYYQVAMSTPTEFYNSVNGKGFNEGYGLQCVAGFKEFMYSLSGKYIATSTGGASGYAKQQSQIEPLGFKWYSGTSGLQDGDWAIWTTGTYGHVAMYYNGKWFGQNQYATDPNAGNAFSLVSISTNGIAGYYRPNIYQNQTPVVPVDPDTGEDVSVVGDTYVVQAGDTLGEISLKQGWWVGTTGLYGDSGYAQRLAEYNSIQNRGIIYPNQIIKKLLIE